MTVSYLNHQALLRCMKGTKRMSLKIPETVFQQLTMVSERTGNPLSSIVRSALDEYLSQVKE